MLLVKYSLNLLTAFLRWAEMVHTCTMVSHLEAEQGWWTCSGLFHSGHLGLTAECLSCYPLGLTTCAHTYTHTHKLTLYTVSGNKWCFSVQWLPMSAQYIIHYLLLLVRIGLQHTKFPFILTDVELELSSMMLHSKSLVKLNSWLHWVKAIQVS